jgi:hypothetical protein
MWITFSPSEAGPFLSTALCPPFSGPRNGLSVRLQDSDFVVGALIADIGVGSSALVRKWVLEAIFPAPSLALSHRSPPLPAYDVGGSTASLA